MLILIAVLLALILLALVPDWAAVVFLVLWVAFLVALCVAIFLFAAWAMSEFFPGLSLWWLAALAVVGIAGVAYE